MNSPPSTSESERKGEAKRVGRGGGQSSYIGLYTERARERETHREAYRRETEGGKEGTRRGSVAPRSHAFRSVMAVGPLQTLFVRPRRVHMHTPEPPSLRAPNAEPRGPASLPPLKERKNRRGR